MITMNKKAYFFLIDAIIALFVIGIGITLVITTSTFQEPTRQPEVLTIDVMQTLQKKIVSIGNNYCGANSVLVLDGNITDQDDRLMQQLGSMYYRHQQGCTFCMDLMKACFESVLPVEGIGAYSIELNINHEYIHAINLTEREQAKLIIPQRSITFGIYNNQFFGPYTVEVFVWN